MSDEYTLDDTTIQQEVILNNLLKVAEELEED